MANTNKTKGSNAERHYAKIFREIGYNFCKTSRAASRLHDDSKIDLVFIPWNIQVKAGKQASLNPGKELTLMQECIKVNFPETELIHKNPCILIHYEQNSRGKKRTEENEKVYMTPAYYSEVFQEVKILFEKTYINVQGEYRTLVCITFEDFKTIIKKQ